MAHDESAPLPQFPEPGFYYHYKHDPAGPVGNYAYEVVSIGYHTEDDCRPEDQYLVIYRPLYDAFVYRAGKGMLYDVRPLAMFMEEVIKDGMTQPRFARITDPEVTRELAAIRDLMYAV